MNEFYRIDRRITNEDGKDSAQSHIFIPLSPFFGGLLLFGTLERMGRAKSSEDTAVQQAGNISPSVSLCLINIDCDTKWEQ